MHAANELLDLRHHSHAVGVQRTAWQEQRVEMVRVSSVERHVDVEAVQDFLIVSHAVDFMVDRQSAYHHQNCWSLLDSSAESCTFGPGALYSSDCLSKFLGTALQSLPFALG